MNKRLDKDGENISVGEKQLICITRAILRKSKIIVMDEATVSIDIKTENIIQNTIKNLLNQNTIIAIAHRINTILKSDRVLVLDKGNIAELDSPNNLMNKKDSLLYQLYYNSQNNI